MSTATDSRLRELHQALATKSQEMEGLSLDWKFENEGKDLVVNDEQKAKFQRAVADAEEIKNLITLEERAAGIRSFGSGAPGTPEAGDAAVETHAFHGVKSIADLWFESDAYAEMKGTNFREFGQMFELDRSVHAMPEAKDVYSAMGGNISIPALGRAQNLGLTERALRPGRVRDLFPAEATTASILYGIRETGFTNRAATVPERRAADGVSPPVGDETDVYGLKPRSSLSIAPVTYHISTIAHIMYAHRQTLADEPRMRGLIDRDMVDGIKMVEDEQILYGDGTGENLRGLVNTTGIQTYTQVGNPTATPPVEYEPKSMAVRRAATRALLAYFDPTGVVLHPLDWEDMELERDNNGAYTVAVSVALGAEKRIWRLRVADTPAMTESRFLVGAFGTGAKLYDREQVNIQVSTENRDLFERNAVTIRAEERVGLVVDRPESFVYGQFTSPS